MAGEAFSRWFDRTGEAPEADAHAGMIANALHGLIQEDRVSIPRGARCVIVEPREN